MSSLTACLNKAGSRIDQEDKDLIRQLAEDYKSDGMSAENAATAAVRDVIETASNDRLDLITQIAGLNVRLPDVALAPSDAAILREFESVSGDPPGGMTLTWTEATPKDLGKLGQKLYASVPFSMTEGVRKLTEDERGVLSSAIATITNEPHLAHLFDEISGFGAYIKDNAGANYHIGTNWISVNKDLLAKAAAGDALARVRLVRFIAHEAHHLLETNGNGVLYSPNAPDFKIKIKVYNDELLDAEMGSVAKEAIWEWTSNENGLSEFFTYPLGYMRAAHESGRGMHLIQSELLAQLGSLYIINPELMKRALPESYALMETIHGTSQNPRQALSGFERNRTLREALRVSTPGKRIGNAQLPGADGKGNQLGQRPARITGRPTAPARNEPTPVENLSGLDEISDLGTKKKRSIADLHKRIPPEERVARKQSGVRTHISGKPYSEVDLDATQSTLGASAHDIDKVWGESVGKSGQAAEETVARLGMRPRSRRFWEQAFALNDRARYWYEISAEKFRELFPDLTDHQLRQFISVVAATSPLSNPYDNLRRAVGAFSQYMRGDPIDIDLVIPKAVREALKEADLEGLKTGSFGGTMQYVIALTEVAPLSTNDRQVASSFKVTGDDIAKNPELYEVLSRFYIGLRDAQNATLPDGADPFETWQIQAIGWVQERMIKANINRYKQALKANNTKEATRLREKLLDLGAEKDELQFSEADLKDLKEKNASEDYDDYWMAMTNESSRRAKKGILQMLSESGINVGGVITRQDLMTSGVETALSDTVTPYREAHVATVEVNERVTQVGKEAMELFDQAVEVGDKVATRTMLATIASALGSAQSRHNGPFNAIASVILGKNAKLTRIDTPTAVEPYAFAGTFAGDMSPNIRVPMMGMNADQRAVLLATIGKAWNQMAMAGARFSAVEGWGVEPAPGASRGAGLFVETTEALGESSDSFLDLAKKIGKGHEVIVTKVPNGYILNITPAFPEDGPPVSVDPTSIAQAAGEVFGKYSHKVWPADYFSEYGRDYLEGSKEENLSATDVYNSIISAWKRGLRNDTVREISEFTGVGRQEVRGFLREGTWDESTKLAVHKRERAERYRDRLNRRLDTYDRAVESAEAIARKLAKKQQAWIDRYGPRIKARASEALLNDSLSIAEGGGSKPPPKVRNSKGKYGCPEVVNERYEEAHKGMGDTRKMFDRAKEWWTNIGHGISRHWKTLPQNKFFAQAYEWLRRLEQAPENATETAVRTLREITASLTTQDEYDVFNRFVVLEDMMHDRAMGLPLAFGFTKDTLPTAHARMKSIVQADPNVKKALAARYKLINDVGDQLVKAGILKEDNRKNPAYFRHQVLEYARVWDRVAGSGSTVKKPKADYAKLRKGSSDKDYNTNYFETEMGFLQQAHIDLATAETIKLIKGSDYNILGKLSKEEMEQLKKDKAIELDGQRYVEWQPDKGNLFFFMKTISEKGMDVLIEEAFDPVSQVEGVDPDVLKDVILDLKERLVLGPKKPSLVIPQELAETLDGFRTDIDRGLFDHVFATPLRMWKQWVLINPRKVLQYNINNLSGDLDAVIAGNPHALRMLPRAIRELYRYHYKGEIPSQELQNALTGGVFNSALSMQEIPDINHFSEFSHLIEQSKTGKVTDNTVGKAWRGLRNFTAWRENWLRYAAYLDYYTRLKDGEAVSSIGYGAALPEMIDGLGNVEEKAAMLARELVGDYGAVSAYGQEIRAKVIPFYSWMEINTKRYKRLFQNAVARGKGQGAYTATVLATHGVLRMFVLYGLVNLWNNLFFGDEEEELDVTERVRLHLILGRDKDNNIHMLRFQGALSDFLGWVGFDQVAHQVMALDSGRADWEDVIHSAVMAGPNKVASGWTPVMKLPAELAMGLSVFPDISSPRPIRDRLRYTAKVFSAENEYDVLVDNPSRGYLSTLPQLVAKKRHAGEIAYYRARSMATEWNDKRTGHSGTSLHTSPRSEALRKYRLALKYKDMEAAAHFRQQLRDLGVKARDLKKSIRAAHPLAPVPMRERSRFKRSLSDREREVLSSAIDYYNDIYR